MQIATFGGLPMRFGASVYIGKYLRMKQTLFITATLLLGGDVSYETTHVLGTTQ